MKRVSLLLLVLLGITVLAATGLETRTPATVTGTVTFFGTGQTIYGASVFFGTYGSYTGTNGVYQFEAPEGVYTAICHRPGYLDIVRENILVLGGRTFTMDFVLYEFPYPPTNLRATRDGYALNLEWNYPTISMDNGSDPSLAESGERSASPTDESGGQRSLLGYRVWRLLYGQEYDPEAWVLCISETTYSPRRDISWAYQAPETYRWAVKAIYSDGNFSAPAISNYVLWPTEFGTVTGTVTHPNNAPLANAVVWCGPVVDTTDASGHYSLNLFTGPAYVYANHPLYGSCGSTMINVAAGQTVTHDFQWHLYDDDYVDSFEDYDDFSADLSPWCTFDMDLSATYGMGNIDWPGEYQPAAFMVFNPSATVPPLSGAVPFEGAKFLACFSASTGLSDDWLISPRIPNSQPSGVEISFRARSYTDSYGLEKFNVGKSLSVNPYSMQIISGTQPVSVPTEWTHFTYHISGYSSPFNHFGIQCVSDNAFMLMIDMVSCHYYWVDADDPAAPEIKTALTGNFPNPFNPQTTISYSLKRSQELKLEIFNLKGQHVKTLYHDIRPAGSHSVVWQGNDDRGRPVSSGIYLCKMTTAGFAAIAKLMLSK